MLSCRHPEVEEVDSFEKYKERLMNFLSELALQTAFVHSLEPLRVLSLGDKPYRHTPARFYVNEGRGCFIALSKKQTTIVKAFLRIFYYFESFYQTFVNGGHRTNRIYRPDYTYIQVRTTEEIQQWDAAKQPNADDGFRGSTMTAAGQDEGGSAYIPKLHGKPRRDPPCSPSKKRTVFMNRGNQANIHATFRQTLETVVAQMEKIGLTETEFVAMCLLLVFEPNREHLSEISKKVLSRARDQLFKEWAEFYTASGAEDGDERLGNCVLLLASVRQQVHHHHSIAHMFRLFGMTDYDKIIDDIYM